MASVQIHPPDFSSFLFQDQSSLFSTLPPEIRSEVFAYALTSYEDTHLPYRSDTYWARPGYLAPHRVSTGLLRTCKRVYQEAWFMPFAFAEHSFYLTSSDRAPRSQSPKDFKKCLDLIHHVHGKLEAGRIRLFAQLFVLQPGTRLQNILNMPHFHPKSITLTIRYTDFWYWEDNEPLYIDAAWVNKVRFPNSVTRFAMDFETIERRKAEVDHIANEAARKWLFRRRDGRILTCLAHEMAVTKWTGSSILGERRWIRDESRPGQLDYHVVTATWRLSMDSDAQLPASCPKVSVPPDFIRPTPGFTYPPSLGNHELQAASISPDTPAEDAWTAVQAYRRNTRRGRVHRLAITQRPGD